MVRLRILGRENCVFPLVRYPVNPRHRYAVAGTNTGDRPEDEDARD